MKRASSGGPVTLAVGISLVVAAWILGRSRLSGTLAAVMPLLPLMIGGLAILLAARFQRSRLVSAAALVVVAAWWLHPVRGELGQGEMMVVLFLVSPGFAALALLSDGRVFSAKGMTQLLPAATLAVAGLLLQHHLVPGTLVHTLARVQPGWGTVLAAMVIALFGYLVRRGVVDAAFLPALAAVALALSQVDAGGSPGPALAAAQMVFLAAGAEEAYRLAFHDQLTGLPGRRALEEALGTLRGQFSVAMVDIDHFKRFNDRFGHDAGDQVLRMVATELLRVPAGGRAYRYGGEEFVVIYQGLDGDAAVTATEALREGIARRRFHLRGAGRPRRRPKTPRPAKKAPALGISVSAGVATVTAKRRSGKDVLLAADTALYRAKKKGRNRVEKSR